MHALFTIQKRQIERVNCEEHANERQLGFKQFRCIWVSSHMTHNCNVKLIICLHHWQSTEVPLSGDICLKNFRAIEFSGDFVVGTSFFLLNSKSVPAASSSAILTFVTHVTVNDITTGIVHFFQYMCKGLDECHDVDKAACQVHSIGF